MGGSSSSVLDILGFVRLITFLMCQSDVTIKTMTQRSPATKMTPKMMAIARYRYHVPALPSLPPPCQAWVDCEEEFKAHLDSLSKLPLYATAKTAADVLTDRNIETNTPAELPGEDGIQTAAARYEADEDGDVEMADEEEENASNKEDDWGEVYEGDRVAKKVGSKIYFGTVMQFGYIEKDGEDIDAWCVKFDKKIVTYMKSRRKGYKEDFDFEELQAAIELYKEHEEEDK